MVIWKFVWCASWLLRCLMYIMVIEMFGVHQRYWNAWCVQMIDKTLGYLQCLQCIMVVKLLIVQLYDCSIVQYFLVVMIKILLLLWFILTYICILHRSTLIFKCANISMKVVNLHQINYTCYDKIFELITVMCFWNLLIKLSHHLCVQSLFSLFLQLSNLKIKIILIT